MNKTKAASRVAKLRNGEKDDWASQPQLCQVQGTHEPHVCWCGAFHGQGADYTGRWENYIPPEIRADKT